MDLLEKISTAVNRPRFAALQFNRAFSDLLFTRFRPRTNFFEEDWDNLIILDACRYDLFKSVWSGSEPIDYRWSPASQSEEFIKFHSRYNDLSDTVWVTANPWVSKFGEGLYDIVDVWDEGWDEELQTVLPETVRDAAISAQERYPDKRLVVHFMQPHYPFIGEFAQEFLPSHRTFTGDGLIQDNYEEFKIWDLLERGEVSREAVWRGYLENLELVLPIATDLARNLTGRSVITSDHGNELGGRLFPFPIAIYGHPGRLRTKNLVKVPWVLFESEDRPRITTGTPVMESSETETVIDDRLKALGYR